VAEKFATKVQCFLRSNSNSWWHHSLDPPDHHSNSISNKSAVHPKYTLVANRQ